MNRRDLLIVAMASASFPVFELARTRVVNIKIQGGFVGFDDQIRQKLVTAMREAISSTEVRL